MVMAKPIPGYFFLIFFLVFFTLSPVFSESNDKNGAEQEKKSTVTISREQYDRMVRDMQSMQEQINSLKAEFERLKKDTTSPARQPEAASEAQPPPSQGGTEALQPPPGETQGASHEALLKELEKDMQTTGEAPAAHQHAPGDADANPKISLIGDFIWNINHNKGLDGGDPFEIREIELGFQDAIDPWTKAVVYLSLSKDDTGKYTFEPEEAYVTFNKMPFKTQMRMGEWRLPFGKDNPLHPHAKPYVDQPDVITNFLGPDGMKGTGMEVSTLLPTGKLYTELIGDVVNDQNDASFSNGASGKPLYLAHLRMFSDLDESSNLELGYSFLNGYNNDIASQLTLIQGADLTYRWKPLKSGNYTSFLLRGEYLWSHRCNPDRTVDSSGYYGLAQYQLNRNWYIGARYDNTGYPDLINCREHALNGILTYFPTEFSFYRLQWKKTVRDFAPDYCQWLFQMNFSIGPHGTHKF
jgi:hypothetical protein